MDSKTAGLVLIVAASFFLIGRSTAPDKTRIITETVEIESKSNLKEDLTIKSKTVTEVTRPDGTKIKQTKVTKEDKKSEKIEQLAASVKHEDKTVERRTRFIIGPVISASMHNYASPSYGLHAYSSLIGPLGLGISFLNNSTVNIYAGVSF